MNTQTISLNETPKAHNAHLTSGRLLVRNTLWNLVGSIAPMVVAVFCIPVLIRELGKDRFGVLTLAWALIGYASLFDLGLGRALTQLVARKLGAGEEREIPSLVWTSLLIMVLLGFVGAACVFLISPWLARHGLNVPAALQGETQSSFRWLGVSIPFVITTAGLRGLLEAHQRFGLINALRIPMGVFTFAGPLLVLPFSKSVVPVVAVLVAARAVAWVGHLMLCLQVAPELRQSLAWERSVVGPLVRFGGWMTVTNVISPLMLMSDRFFLGALVSVTAVAYYATPYDVVTKILLFPLALIGVMFPAFSTTFAHDPARTGELYRRSLKFIWLALFPLILCTVALAQDGLRIWLGPEFTQHGFRALQILALGVFINSLAQVPFWLLQGVGRPDLCAKLHLIELPLYLVLLWSLIKMQGIEGAATAWTARVTIDALVLFGLASRFLPSRKPIHWRSVLLAATALLFLVLAALPQALVTKGVFLSGALIFFAIVVWFRLLTPEERLLAQNFTLNGP